MVDYNTISGLQNRALEIIYRDKVMEATMFGRAESVLFNRIRRDDANNPKITTRGYDNKYILPYLTQIPMSAGWIGEAKPLPPSGKESVTRLTTSLCTLKGRYQRSIEEGWSSVDPVGYIVKTMADLQRHFLEDTRIKLIVSMYGYEYGGATPANAYHVAGALGTVHSFSTSTVTMRAHASFKGELGCRWIKKGMRVLFGTIGEITGATVAYGTEALVSSVDTSANTFTITDTDGTTWSGTDPAANDVVLLGWVSSTLASNTVYNAYDYAPISLREHVSTSTRRNYQGAARSSLTSGQIAHASGTARDLSDTILQNALMMVETATMERLAPDAFITMSLGTKIFYRNLFNTLYQYQRGQEPDGAKVYTAKPTIDGHQIFEDPWHPDGEINILDLSSFLQITPMGADVCRFHQFGGGSIWALLGSTNSEIDVEEARWRTQYQLAGLGNYKNVRIKDLN